MRHMDIFEFRVDEMYLDAAQVYHDSASLDHAANFTLMKPVFVMTTFTMRAVDNEDNDDNDSMHSHSDVSTGAVARAPYGA